MLVTASKKSNTKILQNSESSSHLSFVSSRGVKQAVYSVLTSTVSRNGDATMTSAILVIVQVYTYVPTQKQTLFGWRKDYFFIELSYVVHDIYGVPIVTKHIRERRVE